MQKENRLTREFSVKNVNVLYLDDDLDVLESCKSMHRFDFNIFTTVSVNDAIEIIESNDIHIIIADQQMPNMSGLDFFSSIIDKYPYPIRILSTGYSDVDTLVNSINSDTIYKYLSKPYSPEEMMRVIEDAARMYFSKKKSYLQHD